MEKAGLVQINIWKVKEGEGERPEFLKQIERTTMLTKTEFKSTYVQVYVYPWYTFRGQGLDNNNNNDLFLLS